MLIEGMVFAGRYRIVRHLGAGGMGDVYEAVDTETAGHVALKTMLAQSSERADLRERFEREATAIGRVDSPFVVKMLGAGVDTATRTRYIVMELLRGENLKCRIEREGRFSPGQAVGYLAQVAHGLGAVHREQIAHRDLKPSNLFVEGGEHEGWRIKIVDFGIVKIFDETAGQDTTAAVGTRAYMAPEQHRCKHITYQVDIYALGMIAFTLLVGRPYWEDELEKYGGGSYDFALTVVHGLPEPASERAGRRGVTLDIRFDAWFARATAVEPARRFRSATSAIGALAKALDVPGFEDLVKQAEDDIEVVPEPPAEPTGGEEPAPDSTRTEPPGFRLPGDLPIAEPSAASRSRRSSTSAQSIRSSTTEAFAKSQERSISGLPALLVGRTGRFLAPIGVIAAAVVGVFFWPEKPVPTPPPVPPPLEAPASILACPPLEASGVDDPAGWLGAAAAAVFCERARVVLGGDPGRTLVPAELLNLPREPTDGFPDDPYAAPDARNRALTAARERAAAYIDGHVERKSSGFRIEASFYRSDGTVLHGTSGEGRALYAAIREAMAPWVQQGVLPKAERLDPIIADFSRARDIDGALLLLDARLAMTQNAGNLPDECAKIATRSEDFSEMGPGMGYLCPYTLGFSTPAVTLPPPEPSSPGSLSARARFNHYIYRVDPPETIAELERFYEKERMGWGQSTLATTLSCLLQSTDPKRAAEKALLAVQKEPKNMTGEWCAPWSQLTAVTKGTASAQSSLRAMQAWQPGDAAAWLGEAAEPHDIKRAIRYARRAYALSPLNTRVANELGNHLLAEGALQEVRGIATALTSGGTVVHHVESNLLLIRMEASEAGFASALERAKRAMSISAEEGGWVRVQRLTIAWHALQVALVLGRAAEIADLAVERFLDPEPPPIDGASQDVPLLLTAICTYASKPVSQRCFSRLHALLGRLSGGILPDTAAFIRGAESCAQGNYPGAAKAWRALLAHRGPYLARLPGAMYTTFDQTNDSELIRRIEGELETTARFLHGASPWMVQAARREAKRGNTKAALQWANRVIDAWSTAEGEPPALKEMQRLKESLGGGQ